MSEVTIYHNPSCGTSRNTLALVRHAGIEPVIIEYLKNPPSREKLRELIAAMGISVRSLLRERGTPYDELNLADPKWSDDDLLDAMLCHPILINRPIVVTELGTKLCRPSEEVLELLPVPRLSAFTKEDGETSSRTAVGAEAAAKTSRISQDEVSRGGAEEHWSRRPQARVASRR
jgi:arsenate reductase